MPTRWLAHAPDRLELYPGCGNVQGTEGCEEEAFRALTAMENEVCLEGARDAPLPLAPGSDGYLAFESSGDGAPAVGLSQTCQPLLAQ